MRPKFVEKVSLETIELIMDCILKDEIINPSEKKRILEQSNITESKARCLIDTVKIKGPIACAKFIAHIAHEDPELHLALGLSGSQPAKSGVLTGLKMEKSFFAFSSRSNSKLCTGDFFLFSFF